MKADIEIIPHGEVVSSLSKKRWRNIGGHFRSSKSLRRTPARQRRVFVSFSGDLDKSFAELFRKELIPDTRLLILNEGGSMDSLLSRILDLQIRTPQRCYVVEMRPGSGRKYFGAALLYALLDRLAGGGQADESPERILDARIENGILRVVSPNFDRLDVPISQVPQLRNADHTVTQKFEIDEDGSFLYWPQLDIHLGWAQLRQLVNPEGALKASQKSEEFNKRYGEAAQKLREEIGLEQKHIPGISQKQLGRIERGECRLTANAIRILSQALKLTPNEYMEKLAKALEENH